MNKFDQSILKILKLIEEQEEYFTNNQKILAKLTQEINYLFFISRVHHDKKMNVSEEIRDLVFNMNNKRSKSYNDLFFSALGHTNIENFQEYKHHPLDSKKQKTLDDHISISEGRNDVYYNLFCDYFTDYMWDSEGFLYKAAFNEFNPYQIFGFNKSVYPSWIKKEIDIIENKEYTHYKKFVDLTVKAEICQIKKNYKDAGFSDLDHNKKLNYSSLKDNSPLYSIPKNYHRSYKVAINFVINEIIKETKCEIESQKFKNLLNKIIKP